MTCSAARDQPTHRIASSRATQPKRQISTAPLAHATRMISSRRSPCQDFPLRRRCHRFPNPAALNAAATARGVSLSEQVRDVFAAGQVGANGNTLGEEA